MKGTVIALALIALAHPAFAQGRVPLNSASSFSLTSTDASCGVSVRDLVTSGQHQYVTRDCDASTSEGFIWLVRWLPGMPTSGTISVDLEGINLDSTGGRNTCIKVSLGCANQASAGLSAVPLTFGTATTSCDDYPLSLTDYTVKTISSIALPSTIATDRWCGLKIERDATNVSDTDTQDWLVRGGAIKW